MSGARWRLGGVALAALAGSGAQAQEPVAAPAMRVGDEWVFERTHERGATAVSTRRINLHVERADEESMVVGVKPEGSPLAYEAHRLGPGWAGMRLIDGQPVVTAQPFKFPLIAGETWTLAWQDPTPRGAQSQTRWRETYRVVGWTDVTTPAGTFRASEVRMTGTADAVLRPSRIAASATVGHPRGEDTGARGRPAGAREIHNTLYSEFYYVPEIRYYVKSIQEQYNAENIRTGRDTDLLISFKPGGPPLDR